jgi:hypothetical protein
MKSAEKAIGPGSKDAGTSVFLSPAFLKLNNNASRTQENSTKVHQTERG